MNKRFLLDLAKYLLAIALLFWVVKSNWAPPPPKSVEGSDPVATSQTESRGLGYVWQRHIVEGQPIGVGYLVVGLSLYLFAVSMTLIRWYLLVRALDIPITLREAFRLGLMGAFFSAFLPGSVGGDLIKAAALAHGQSRRTAAFATVVMDRLLALWGLVWFVAILGSVFWLSGMLEGKAADAASFIVPIALGIVAATVAGWLVVGLLPDHRAERFAGRLKRWPLVGGAASEFWRAAWMYRRQQKCIAIVLVLTWIGQFGFVCAFYCGAHILWSDGMGEVPTLTQHYLLVPIGLVMQALVPTPGGAGGGEWSFGALYVLFGASEANGVLASLVQRVFSWALGLVGYVVYLCMKKVPTPKAEEEPASEPVPAASSC